MSKQKYSNGDISVTWDSKICYHSEVCVKNLPEVFNINKKPWVDVNGANPEKIVDLIDRCPSGALQYKLKNNNNMSEENNSDVKVSLAKNGPILVKGAIELKDAEGNPIDTGKNVALCRCGASSNKPFCDGTHNKIDFEG